MIWTTWRQHRAELTVSALIFGVVATVMVIVGSTARARSRKLGLPACLRQNQDCSSALDALHRDFHTIPPFTAALIALPLLAGMFLAAPLVSREYEAGTHRLAWTQSVSPLRWITVKIAMVFGVIVVAASVLGLLASWALDPLMPAFGGRYNSTWYDVQGIVAVACMLFALVVGVAASALIRRTIPAMAVTLVVYAAARIPIHWVRWHFAPLASRTTTVAVSDLLQSPGGNPQDYAGGLAPGDWFRTLTVTDSAGHPIATKNGNFGILQHYCPDLQAGPGSGVIAQGRVLPGNGGSTGAVHDGGLSNLASCRSSLAGISIRERISYQPASHFWIVQTVEGAIFLAVAILLIAVAILTVARRHTV